LSHGDIVLGCHGLCNCFAKVPRPFAKEKSVTLMDMISRSSMWVRSTFHSTACSLAKRKTNISNASDDCYVRNLSGKRSHGVGKMKVITLWFKRFDYVSILSILGTVPGLPPGAINLRKFGYLCFSRQMKRKILQCHQTLWSCFFHARLGLPPDSPAGYSDQTLSWRLTRTACCHRTW
jgi:hypothetical protein